MNTTPLTALIVVAHPDDETFGPGSVIADLAAAGYHVTVCCATRGEAGEAPPSIAAELPLGELRERELRAAEPFSASATTGSWIEYRSAGSGGHETVQDRRWWDHTQAAWVHPKRTDGPLRAHSHGRPASSPTLQAESSRFDCRGGA